MNNNGWGYKCINKELNKGHKNVSFLTDSVMATTRHKV